MFLADKATISYLAGCTATHDIFLTVLFIHVGAQLDLLKRRLEWCRENVYRGSEIDFIVNHDSIYSSKVESVCRSIFEEDSLDRIVELHTCIQHHQTILR